MTGSASRLRSTEPLSPIRSRKREVLREAAERDVLAVVRRRLRIAFALRQRLDGAAERRSRLEHRHVGARVDEVECRGEPREAASDDDRLHRTSPFATTASFAGAESRVFSPKTSNPFASMRSSVAR